MSRTSPLSQPTVPAANAAAEAVPRWTFLTNHAHVLVLLYSQPELVLREVASRVGITERAVQRIVQELEEGGLLERERVGRRNSYRVLVDNHLRHPIEAHCTIADLLDLITPPKKTNKASDSKPDRRPVTS